ncbi:inositol monophosphatase family protein [Amycolatopsis anabasis]|uniref:inositol monophosphatase family protein n=1 Tax=Amycolatopsis anabasis TaxID=1840409 RepID=UPI00131DFBBD|nr:inositol monophosphatase family protein [Amycolatopsis anabasis]
MKDTAELLAVAQAAVEIGYKLMTTTGPGQVHEKGDRDLVTDLDLRIQREIKTYLERAAPGIVFLGEEQGGGTLDQDANYVWALDPIDGTSNFAHGLPLCAVSLALVHRGEPVVAVMVAPFLELRYHAIKGEGSYANGRRMQASTTTSLNKAMVSIGDYAVGKNAAEKNRRRLALTKLLAENVERVRMFGSAALDLAFVAEGRTDACIILANKPWDTAAGVLLAREAGVEVIDATGDMHNFGSRETIAASPSISAALLSLVVTAVAEQEQT